VRPAAGGRGPARREDARGRRRDRRRAVLTLSISEKSASPISDEEVGDKNGVVLFNAGSG